MKENSDTLNQIKLPKPVFKNCKTVFVALKRRKTSRLINDKKFSLQILSDILWASQGINRVKGPFGIPGRTAGSASNSQEIYVYAAMEERTYFYEPTAHKLIPVLAEDIRALAIGAGQGNAGANAPVRLIYIADIEKFKNAGFQEPGLYDREVQKSYYYLDTGLIAQNVYLAASALGLSSWFHNCNKTALKKKLNLNTYQRALFGHTIGYSDD